MVGPRDPPLMPWTRTPRCRLPAAPAGRVLRPTYDASVFPGADRDALPRMMSGYGGLLHWKTCSYELPSVVATIRAAYLAFSQRQVWISAISATTILALTSVPATELPASTSDVPSPAPGSIAPESAAAELARPLDQIPSPGVASIIIRSPEPGSSGPLTLYPLEGPESHCG